MGRIAAMVFDFSFHRTGHVPGTPLSAFSNPVAMESLCAIVAANSVACGPEEISHLVMDWIVPSFDSLPPFAVVAVTMHLAIECLGKGAPAGTAKELRKLSQDVLGKVLAPILADAVRESDAEGEGTINRNHRLAALTLRSLDRWCAATELGIVQLKRICSGCNVNIIDVISDSLYSQAEIVVDALAELFETLLKRNSKDDLVLEGIKLASSMIGAHNSSNHSVLSSTEEMMKQEEIERETILAELVSAVGMQRFRFTGRQSHGDTAVCRCLARIAASITVATQTSLRSGSLQGSADGLIDLLFKAASHPSMHVCGIVIEVLPLLIGPESDLSIRLLPALQSKAIVPFSLVGLSQSGGSQEDCGVDFHEFENFREHILSEALVACYRSSRVYFLRSCASAIEEFCNADHTPHIPYQLEAALFCVGAVAMDASKRALLANASPAAQAAAAKASSFRRGENQSLDIAEDSKRHSEQLARCTESLAKNPSSVTSNPFALAQMCRFIGKYANWYSKAQTPALLDKAAELSLSSFNLAFSSFLDETSSSFIQEMSISPFAEAATALRNILSRCPAHFAKPQALSVLGSGWERLYSNEGSNERINIEDREAICSGICRVLAALPPDQWATSLSALARPTIECLEIVTKKADDSLAATKKATCSSDDFGTLMSVLTRMANEIRLLCTITRSFNLATMKQRDAMASGSKTSTDSVKDPENPLFGMFRRIWPCMSHIAQKFSSYEKITNVLGDFLTDAVSIKGNDGSAMSLLKELSDMSITIMGVAANGDEISAVVPMLGFVREAVDIYGHLADSDVADKASGVTSTTPTASEARQIVEQLLSLGFGALQFSINKANNAGREQGRGQEPTESGPEQQTRVQNRSPDALSGMFSLLTICVERCAILLIQLPSNPGNDREGEGLFTLSVETAASCIHEKEVDVARSSMIFLKTVIDLKGSLSQDTTGSESNVTRARLIVPVMDSAIQRVREDVFMCLITGACGVFPREVLDPAASVLFSLLRILSAEDAEALSAAALNQKQFLLGQEAQLVVLTVLGRCSKGTVAPSVLMDCFADLWQMHQGDDAGAIAGGDVIMDFARKYGA